MEKIIDSQEAIQHQIYGVKQKVASLSIRALTTLYQVWQTR